MGRLASGQSAVEFWHLVAIESDECVLWPYGCTSAGYGQATLEGAQRLVHVAACVVAHGPPPQPKMDAAHRCGVRRCMNGRHLRWASRSENETDKLDHGTDARGEKHGNAKLTEAEVREIRRRYAEPGVTQAELAKAFGVSRGHIGRIVNSTFWGWLR